MGGSARGGKRRGEFPVGEMFQNHKTNIIYNIWMQTYICVYETEYTKTTSSYAGCYIHQQGSRSVVTPKFIGKLDFLVFSRVDKETIWMFGDYLLSE